MHIHPADRHVVKWAIERGLIFSYERNNGLSGTHLKLHMGLVTAFFRHGKLMHLNAATDGRHVDELMRDFTELFSLCAQAQGYLDQSRSFGGGRAVTGSIDEVDPSGSDTTHVA